MQDPVDFAQLWLNENPWQKQRQILRALRDNRQVAVRSCNASGKTFTAALAAIWWLMIHEEALVITTAPSQRQVQHTLWREIRDIWERNKELIGGKMTSTRLELSNKRYAYGFSTNSPDRFQGFHSENVLIVVDEAAGVREFVYEAIQGLTTSRNAKILMIGNPSSLAGTFYDAFHKNRSHWKTIHIAAKDTPNFQNVPVSPARGGNVRRTKGARRGNPCGCPATQGAHPHPSPFCEAKGGRGKRSETQGVHTAHSYIPGLATPEWAENILETRGERSSSYQVRVLGEFPDEADDALIPLKHIEKAVEKLFEDIDSHQPVMGLDVARFGDDQTVAIVRQGNAVVDLASHRKSDLMNTTGIALDIARTRNINTINIDEVGLGSAVVDRIAELNKSGEAEDIKAVGVNGGKKACNTEKFANLRAEMFDGLRQRFADEEISIPQRPRTRLPASIHHLRLQLPRPAPHRIQTAHPRLRPPVPRQSRRPGPSLPHHPRTRTPHVDRHQRTHRTTPKPPPQNPPPPMAITRSGAIPPPFVSQKGDAPSAARRRGFIHPPTIIPAKAGIQRGQAAAQPLSLCERGASERSEIAGYACHLIAEESPPTTTHHAHHSKSCPS